MSSQASFIASMRRRRLREKVVSMLGGKCKLCGYVGSPSVYDFHHLDPVEKEFTISHGLRYSIERLSKELEKVILVCANCHREIHEGLHPGFLVMEDNYLRNAEFEDAFAKYDD